MNRRHGWWGELGYRVRHVLVGIYGPARLDDEHDPGRQLERQHEQGADTPQQASLEPADVPDLPPDVPPQAVPRRGPRPGPVAGAPPAAGDPDRRDPESQSERRTGG